LLNEVIDLARSPSRECGDDAALRLAPLGSIAGLAARGRNADAELPVAAEATADIALRAAG
jgi:hypothetical protein